MAKEDGRGLNAQWVAALAEVKAAGLSEVEPLAGGSINQSWRVSTGKGQWVVRRNATGAGVDRDLECRIARRVADAELGPEVIACEPGYQITRFVDQPAWNPDDLGDVQRVDLLARRLRELHALPAADLSATHWADHLSERLAFSSLKPNAGLRRTVADVAQALDSSSLNHDQRALCHFDLHLGQIVGGQQPLFLDFEYARRANPMLDLCWLVHYHNLTPDAQLPLLAAYYGGADPQLRSLFALGLRLVRLLDLFWLQSQDDEGGLDEASGSRLRQLRLVLC